MARKKRQHFVPRVYLKPFLDPEPPAGWPEDRPFEPCVWVLDPSLMGAPRRRAPENILWKNSLYTLDSDHPERPRIEEGLSRLEGAYKPIQRALFSRDPLSARDYTILTLFVGAQYGRIPKQMDHWQDFIDRLQHLTKQMAPEGSTDDFWKGSEEAGTKSVVLRMQAYASVVANHGHVLVNESDLPFITSDKPVTHTFLHIDEPPVNCYPDELLAPVHTNVEAFFSFLPLSPDTAFVSSPLFANREPGYCRTSDERVIFAMNQLTRYHAADVIIARSQRPYKALTQWVIQAEENQKESYTPRTGLHIYTSSSRHWIGAEQISHEIGDHPLHGRIRFVASGLEDLHAAAKDEDLLRVDIYREDEQVGGMRHAWFSSVALKAGVETIIENWPGGWSAWSRRPSDGGDLERGQGWSS